MSRRERVGINIRVTERTPHLINNNEDISALSKCLGYNGN